MTLMTSMTLMTMMRTANDNNGSNDDIDDNDDVDDNDNNDDNIEDRVNVGLLLAPATSSVIRDNWTPSNYIFLLVIILVI